MKKIFFTQEELDRQKLVLRRKKMQFLICTGIWLLLTVTACLLLNRENQGVCTWINGLGSGIYFCWLLYFCTYGYKKEKVYARLTQEILTGRRTRIVAVITKVETENTGLETEYLLHLIPEDPSWKLRVYRLSSRHCVDPHGLIGVKLMLDVYQNRIAGIEVAA